MHGMNINQNTWYNFSRPRSNGWRLLLGLNPGPGTSYIQSSPTGFPHLTYPHRTASERETFFPSMTFTEQRLSW